jgi:hypothetical protein
LTGIEETRDSLPKRIKETLAGRELVKAVKDLR